MSQSTQPPPLHATLHTTTPLTLPAPLPPLPFLVPSSPTFLPQLYTGPQHGRLGRKTVRASASTRGTFADERASEALKFLIHFVGDMHQPLHLTGRNRGANGVKVSFDGRNTNLHSVWDTSLIAKYLRTIPRNYTRPLPVPALESSFRGTIYDPYIRRIVWEGLGVGRGTGRWESEADSYASRFSTKLHFPLNTHGTAVCAEGEC
ncbi:S1/P1 nuclease-domain-containing protein [Lactarius hatsudake]|nr:S1/P1 nuclease-domain-containing protein [Lactarius hatsudake]